MKKQKILFILISLLLLVCSTTSCTKSDQTRQNIIKLFHSLGLSEELNAPVKISTDEDGLICIVDEGDFFMQYMIMNSADSADVNVIIDPNFTIPPTCDKAVFVTHGWLDKSISDWPADIAKAIRKKTDPNEWVCGVFDWRHGALVINSIDAAKYAKHIAGPRLAKAILKAGPKNLKHLHLIAHSAGCWAIDSAAAIIAKQKSTTIHITYLDAYVPILWQAGPLKGIDKKTKGFVEHYYTKDITLGSTHKDLSIAYNVDLTKIDPGINAHEFPYRWYFATITGNYRRKDPEKGDKLINTLDGIEYGFARSREAGKNNWQKSLPLKHNKKAVVLLKAKNTDSTKK